MAQWFKLQVSKPRLVLTNCGQKSVGSNPAESVPEIISEAMHSRLAYAAQHPGPSAPPGMALSKYNRVSRNTSQSGNSFEVGLLCSLQDTVSYIAQGLHRE